MTDTVEIPQERARDLTQKLRDAEDAVTPLRLRVNELERALSDALSTSDYQAAGAARAALDPARLDLAVATANVTALRTALDGEEAQRQAVDDAIQARRQRDQAQADLDTARSVEAKALSEAEEHLAAVSAGLDAVRESLLMALAAEDVAGNARQDGANAAAVLEGWTTVPHVGRPNRVAVKVDESRLYRLVLGRPVPDWEV